MKESPPSLWFVFIPAAWLTIVVLAGLWLRSRERTRSRPIDEHTDEHWRTR